MRKILLDTDIGNDIDDLLAICCLAGLCNQGLVDVKGLVTSKRHKLAAPYCDFFCKFLDQSFEIGEGNLAEGPVQRTGYLSNYWLLREQFTSIGNLQPGDFVTADDLIKKTLTQHDGITYIGIGFSTNLGRFFQKEENIELFNKSVSQTYLMAGDFSDNNPEFNVAQDETSFRKVLECITGDIFFCGHEIGRKIFVTKTFFENLFFDGKIKPLWLAYFSMKMSATNQFCHDPITMLLATGLYDEHYVISERGKVFLEGNVTSFRETKNGNHKIVRDLNASSVEIVREITTLARNCAKDMR